MATKHHGSGHWRIDEIPYASIDRQRAQGDPYLLYLVAGASFVEITADLYAHNLAEYFSGDPKLERWLTEHWVSEEQQHGQALKRYVEHVWPDFDWEKAYQAFYAEYSPYCTLDNLGPTRALEMVSRCVVETGTATFYTSLAKASPEPVLSQIATHIKDDEHRHYKVFLHQYRRWAESEHTRRSAVFDNLSSRLRELDDEDIYCAVKHVFLAIHPERSFTPEVYRNIHHHFARLARRYYPYRMAARMLLGPLQLNQALQAAILPLLSVVGWLFMV